MPSTSATPVVYDFRRPNKFTREHVRALQIASETFARQFTTALSTTAGGSFEAKVASDAEHSGLLTIDLDDAARPFPG